LFLISSLGFWVQIIFFIEFSFHPFNCHFFCFISFFIP
jgi:hypothetical protein